MSRTVEKEKIIVFCQKMIGQNITHLGTPGQKHVLFLPLLKCRYLLLQPLQIKLGLYQNHEQNWRRTFIFERKLVMLKSKR